MIFFLNKTNVHNEILAEHGQFTSGLSRRTRKPLNGTSKVGGGFTRNVFAKF